MSELNTTCVLWKVLNKTVNSINCYRDVSCRRVVKVTKSLKFTKQIKVVVFNLGFFRTAFFI